VAGTNYKLKLIFETREGPGCRTEVLRTCSNIVVHQPVSKPGCYGGNCLKLIRRDQINCSQPLPSPSPSPPGGYTKYENGIPQEVVILAGRAANDILHLESRIVGFCASVELVEVLDAAKQIVGGTNYKLKLKLKRKEGQGCNYEVEKVFDNIVLNLPSLCFGGDCLGLIEEENINCY